MPSMQPFLPRAGRHVRAASRQAVRAGPRPWSSVFALFAAASARPRGFALFAAACARPRGFAPLAAPRLRSSVGAALALCVVLALPVAAGEQPAEGAPLDEDASRLEGEWYVLAHFSEGTDVAPDTEGAGPQDYRDEVWRIERAGDRLRWTIFPDFGFRDDSGRFEEVRGARARIPHAWRPTANQLAEIRAGLTLVPRSARTRSLRRAGSEGWRSGGGARLGNASSVAYGEAWGIEWRDGRPAFVRAATLRSGRAGSMEGVTLFEADLFDADGGYIEGRYARDGREHGRFFMWRKGSSSERDVAFAAVSSDDSLFGPGGASRMSVVELEQRIAAHEDGRAERSAIRAGIQKLVEESYTRRGLALHPHAAEIDALTLEIERLAVVEGVPLDEVDRRFAAGELLP
jgi:hypothetical protein